MKKIGIGMFCVALCLAVAFIFPQAGKTYQTVTDGGCIASGCHSLTGDNPVHDDKHGYPTVPADCTNCHVATGDTPTASTCVTCHPTNDVGECKLVDLHDTNNGTTCFVAGACHDICAPADTTTTTADETSTTTTTGGCGAKEIYGEGSDEVAVMRYLRDNVLSKSEAGQEIIRLYYMWSPVIARAAQSDDEVKEELKEMVDGILGLVLAEPAKVEKAE